MLYLAVLGAAPVTFQLRKREVESGMHPRKRLSIKSATVTGIAGSVLLGLAGLTLNPAPAKAVVYCTLNIRSVVLPGQV